MTSMVKGFNKKKFIEVLHYLISKTADSLNVGKTVLYKLLYFNDFNYYERTETKMTGETYSKLPFGPAPRHFSSAIADLVKAGNVEEKNVNYHGKKQNKYISLKNPDLSLLSAEERENIDDTLKRYGQWNAKAIEDYSHQDTPWRLAEYNGDLNYELVFYRTKEMAVREYLDDDY